MIKKYYRVTWEGYLEGEFENEEKAKQELINHIRNEEFDVYGRDWTELIEVEELIDE